MTAGIWILLTVAAIAGHFASALFLLNRLHAQTWSYRLRQVLERLLAFAAIALPVVVIANIWQLLLSMAALSDWRGIVAAWLPLLAGYVVFCWCVVLLSIPLWLWPKLRYRVPDELVANDRRVVDLGIVSRRTVRGAFPRLCASLPGNEVFQLNVQTKRLQLPRLPRELSGLKIAHLTDLHLTGKIGQEYYAEVVRLTNELEPDLIVMTGDIAEKTKCLPWIKPLFTDLQAPFGKYFILGNHDFLLPKPGQLREELRAAGFIDIAGRCDSILVRDVPLLIAGNELPWHGPAPKVPAVEQTFRLLLAHTPDLFVWAAQQQFDLMVAGHNHGGQICLPLIGPLVSPSRHGVRYAAGLFREGPTLMHVGRGIGGEHLLRWNCPPELALLVLESG